VLAGIGCTLAIEAVKARKVIEFFLNTINMIVWNYGV
jgi:hypothetical protein